MEEDTTLSIRTCQYVHPLSGQRCTTRSQMPPGQTECPHHQEEELARIGIKRKATSNEGPTVDAPIEQATGDHGHDEVLKDVPKMHTCINGRIFDVVERSNILPGGDKCSHKVQRRVDEIAISMGGEAGRYCMSCGVKMPEKRGPKKKTPPKKTGPGPSRRRVST